MRVEQFVMAYHVEQDRLRAMLPRGFESLRPVLRFNAELRTEGDKTTPCVELNTPVEGEGKRGWLNIARWEGTPLTYDRAEKAVTFRAPFLTLSFTAVGLEGGCPAERDNDGCFYPDRAMAFVPAEQIDVNKEFCDCSFAWSFRPGDAHGESTRETLPAFPMDRAAVYPAAPLTAEEAASIPCDQVLGCYVVRFDR